VNKCEGAGCADTHLAHPTNRTDQDSNQKISINGHVCNKSFIKLIFSYLPRKSYPAVVNVAGDPAKAHHSAWKARAYKGQSLNTDMNTYICVSSFTKSDDGYFGRRKVNFSALHALMIDDLGEKIPMERLKLTPTVLIETSKDNYQAWLKLSEPITDLQTATQLISAVLYQGLDMEVDTGMLGVTRIGRLPEGINGKKKHNNWRVRTAAVNADVSYTLDEIVEAYGLDLEAEGKVFNPKNRVSIPAASDPYLTIFDSLGMTISPIRNGVVDITCPWIDEHSDRGETGTAYFIGRGFKCHHGHCEHRRMRDVDIWLLEQGYDVNAIRRALLKVKAEAILQGGKDAD